MANPVMDWLMPFFSGNRLFIPSVLCTAILLIWRGGARGRVFVGVLAIILALGDTFVINIIKHAVARVRPMVDVPSARELVGYGGSGSMPSSHTSTWFAATLIAFTFYRPSWRVMLPLACMVGLSRIYVGAHYPSDVIAGAVLGAGYAAAGLWVLNTAWRTWGRTWYPDQWRRWPSLFAPPRTPEEVGSITQPAMAPVRVDTERRWMMLGYVLIVASFVVQLVYLSAGKIELSEDEAYQWTWSKHLALSYYSKPPFIAYA